MMHIFTISASEKDEFEAWKKEHDAKIRENVIEKCKQILLDAMCKDGKTKCHNYMVAINEMEQLKEQKNLTCFDCEHHFMSDCYLECNKHNRINDNKICDDFEHLKEQNI